MKMVRSVHNLLNKRNDVVGITLELVLVGIQGGAMADEPSLRHVLQRSKRYCEIHVTGMNFISTYFDKNFRNIFQTFDRKGAFMRYLRCLKRYYRSRLKLQAGSPQEL